EEFDILDSSLALVVAREREHLVRHVEPVRLACRSYSARGEDHVDPAARSQVEHGFTGLKLGERGRIPASERRRKRLGGQRRLLAVAVEIRRDRVSRGRRRTAARAALVRDSIRRLRILLPDSFPYRFVTHRDLL